jgi:hypothetical protein
MESNTPYQETPEWRLMLQSVPMIIIIVAIVAGSLWGIIKITALFGATHPIKDCLITWAALGALLPLYWPRHYRRNWKTEYFGEFVSSLPLNLFLGPFAVLAMMPV